MPAAGWIALVHSGSPYTYRHKHLQSGQNGFGFNVNRRTGPAYTWLYRETRYKQRLAVTLKSPWMDWSRDDSKSPDRSYPKWWAVKRGGM